MNLEKKQRATDRFSPDKQLSIFSQTRFLAFLALAVVVHVVFFTVTSMSYIRDTWLFPEAAELRREQEKKANMEAAKGTVLMQAGQMGSSNVAAVVSAETSTAARVESFAIGTNALDETDTNANPFLKKVLEEMPQDGRPTNSKIIRNITDLPKKEEIPAQPVEEITLRIEDTN